MKHVKKIRYTVAGVLIIIILLMAMFSSITKADKVTWIEGATCHHDKSRVPEWASKYPFLVQLSDFFFYDCRPESEIK